MSRLEQIIQRDLKKRLEREFPGCFIIELDPQQYQGVPDLLILYGPKWAMLEVKESATAPYQPNQEYYIELFGRMAYCSVIYPEIEEVVFHELQRALNGRG